MSFIKTEILTNISSSTKILELSNNYKSNTVSVKLIDTNGETPVAINEIGENYIEILDNLTNDSTLKVVYELYQTTVTPQNLIERVVTLELENKELKNNIILLEKAVKNRVSNETFNLWIKIVEKKLGLSIPDQNLFAANTVYTGP